jgi:hypothetical protein
MASRNYLNKSWEDITVEDMEEMSAYLKATMDEEKIEEEQDYSEPTLFGQAYLENLEKLQVPKRGKGTDVLPSELKEPIFFPKGLLNL